MFKSIYRALTVLLILAFSAQAQSWVTVTRVIDGDTLLLETGERVRLIGVDTPETVHPTKPVEYFGKEASAFTKRMAEGKKVRLEYDWERKDKYGRTLAYVYLDDGTFLNAEIIKQGYGFAYTQFPFKYLDEFRQYEREAREKGIGLWGKQGVGTKPDQARAPTKEKEDVSQRDKKEETVYITRTGERYHRDGCRYLSRSRIPIKKGDAIAQGYTPCKVCRP